ncbi:MAG TPA: hypothetical protein PK880_12510 [Candidatus Competibacter sp.]|nr:hypothetical protein [Candidatus Competibacter sp.]
MTITTALLVGDPARAKLAVPDFRPISANSVFVSFVSDDAGLKRFNHGRESKN